MCAEQRIFCLLLFEGFFRAVLARVAHGVPAEAVGSRFDERGKSLVAGATNRGREALLHVEHVLDEEAIVRDAVALRAQRHVFDGVRALKRRAHRELVVLADEDHRELPQGREVQGLVEVADGDGALAEEADRDIAIAAVFGCECSAGSERDVPTDDAVAAQHPVLGVEQMHRAAEATRASRRFAEELGHQLAWAHAARQRDAVIAVRADDVVARLERGGGADGDGLLANVKMEETADFPLGVGPRRFFFHAADEEHLAIEPEQVVVRGRHRGGR